ncbi:SDR family oxidoreductase [Cryomorpha ignava]|uniref:SDR family oxidoreductase n=1 Tax=Cryomorpha ignava TaxID=101383 RepID=A0A7K3WV24_9FLAO|nr:SDR family oxidoreductase [Cryomorpha ignava]NEN25378.1 SDR family oxidoreductase [Cryomorpha ignava]
MDFKDKHILITGATAGIGKALLEELMNRGADKIAVLARNQEKLDALKTEFPKVEILAVSADVSNPKDLDRAISEIEKTWGALDILINNAGVVSAGALEDISDEDIVNQVAINLTGPILLTKKCLHLLKKSNEGAIVNVSSGLGFIAWPFYNVYAATKAGIRQFSDALRRDLYQYPLHIMTIYPTATETPMMKNAAVENMDDPKMVARVSLDGLINKEHHVIFGGEQRLIDIELNHSDPDVIDRKAIERYDALRERTEKHRAM